MNVLVLVGVVVGVDLFLALPTGKLLIAGGGAAEREESTTTIRGWLKNVDFTSDNR